MTTEIVDRKILITTEALPYSSTTLATADISAAENPGNLSKSVRTLTKTQRYLLREKARADVNGVSRINEQNMLNLGLAHNSVLVSRLNNPGGREHHSAMRRLTQIIANHPDALSAIKQLNSEFGAKPQLDYSSNL